MMLPVAMASRSRSRLRGVLMTRRRYRVRQRTDNFSICVIDNQASIDSGEEATPGEVDGRQ